MPARAQSLFWSQSRGLLARSWHYQRREKCANVCNFLVPPLVLVLLVGLDRVLQPSPDTPESFERDPRGGFAARPFEADQCADRIRDLRDPAAVARECAADPFVPKVDLPYHAPDGPGAALAAAVLDGYSLSPFIYPESLPTSNDSFALNQTWYDGTFLNRYSEGMDKNSPLYAVFAAAEGAGPGTLDVAYGLTATRLPSRAALLSEIFDSWFSGGAFATYAAAYGFDRVAGARAEDLDADVTVYYNQSEAAGNCTETCAVFSAVQRLDAAVFAAQAPGRSAAAYLRRMPNTGYEEGLNIIGLIISIILALLLHFFLPFFTGFLVYERTSRLRELMSASGCRPRTYWFTTYIALYLQYAIVSILLTVVGMAIGVPFFALNEFLTYAILFFVWGHCVVALAIFLAPFFSSAETATVLVWLAIILINFVGGSFIGRLISVGDATSELYWGAVMLLPSFALFRSVFYAGAFNTGGQGITVSSASEYQGISLGMCGGEGPFCRTIAFLLGEWLLLMVLGLYLDQVLPTVAGVRKHPLFFLGFKRGRAKGADDLLAMDADANELPEVAAERDLVARTVAAGPEKSDGIVLDSIHKVYAEAKPAVHAVRGMSWVARPGEITGLLGSNGSGKTSAIRALIGAHDLSAGEAYINGMSVRSQMPEILRSMGICLQQDIQWASLSVREHLFFFGRLRNIPKRELAGAVDRAMEAVNLAFAAKRKSSECSGGMRRRLSVAMSLLGDPKAVLLDEPTSALDPATCALVWKAIEEAKAGKSIVITTHSMEEASVLCDRLHMVTRGALRTTGIPEDLRLRLGRGYRLAAAVPESKVADFHDVMMGISDECRVETSLGGSLQYSIPKSVRLSSIFDTMAAHKERLRVRDWGVSQSSLEDVFLNIVARDEAEVGVTKLVPTSENA